MLCHLSRERLADYFAAVAELEGQVSALMITPNREK